ncbi:hypothetical protein BJ508DRAFT_366922 [Ascobolus immersus RN42]|uniref:superoxide dismutase n=1 Tax=Ascobolus immersus RN42 TaxID=1160509 RepID=A0A3N4HMI0_ASCIM|nr:hypothetical protein BJ508DRAFT_366922 [Ascobolus immersus RN42]
MKFLSLALLVLPAVLAQDIAPKTNNQPSNVTYEADFDKPNGIKGKFVFSQGKGGEGVHVKVDLSGFDSQGLVGPFKYHLHDAPVPTDGNCNGTLAHLDPYQRGQTPPCNKDKPETCEVGDLSGKHTPDGAFNTSEYANEYTDLYIDLRAGNRGFFGNRSITIHGKDGVRIACSNFTLKTTTGSPKDNTTKPGTPKGDDKDDSDSNSGKAGNGTDGDGNADDSAAGITRVGVAGLTFAVAAVVGLLL